MGTGLGWGPQPGVSWNALHIPCCPFGQTCVTEPSQVTHRELKGTVVLEEEMSPWGGMEVVGRRAAPGRRQPRAVPERAASLAGSCPAPLTDACLSL